MKNIIIKSLFAVPFFASVLSAFAEAGGRQDNSMTLVYLFLGICGLIILLQLMPVFALVYGMVKGIFGKKEDELESVQVKNRF